MTFVLRLTTLSFASSCLRLRISVIKLSVCFLGNPACYGHLVGTDSEISTVFPERLIAGYSVPDIRDLNV